MALQKITTNIIEDNAVTGPKIALGSDVAGDIMYSNGTDYVRLPKGDDGDELVLEEIRTVFDKYGLNIKENNGYDYNFTG